MSSENTNILLLKDISLGYKPGDFLVESINANVQTGEMVALVGRNGTGKSTLLRAIAGIRQTEKGEISLKNRHLKSYSKSELSSIISFVGTGRTISENMSVFEMVSLGRHPFTNWWGAIKEEDIEKIEESIRFVGMENHVDSKVEQLSDGERQRVMIASALAQDTRIIILDEPTAFLDIPNRIGIAEVLYKLKMSGKSVIFSTHDFDSAFNYADKLWVIHEKSLLQGAPEDLGLINTFEEIFKDSDVVFDDKNLRFKRNIIPGKNMLITGRNKRIFMWTCRAMERIGYTIRKNTDAAEIEVEFHENGDKPVWFLKENGNTFEFHSLYELTNGLTEVKL